MQKNNDNIKKQGTGCHWQTSSNVKRHSSEEAMVWMDFVLEEKKAHIMVFAIDLLNKLQAKEDVKQDGTWPLI